MVNRSELRHAWESIYEKRVSPEQPEKGVVAFAQFLRHRLPLTVLDAGCGRGRNASYLCQQGFTVYGCDLSSPAIRTASSLIRQSRYGAFFQVADLIRLPFPSNHFEAAICVHVLPYHRTDDLISGIGELWRVLQTDGWLYLDLLDCEDVEYGRGKKLEEHTFLDQDGVPIHFSSRQEISRLLSNFTVQQQTRLKYGSKSRTRMVWEIWATKNQVSRGSAIDGR